MTIAVKLECITKNREIRGFFLIKLRLTACGFFVRILAAVN